VPFSHPDYQLLEKIGEGGFGQVYKALKRSTQQWVAVKLLTMDTQLSEVKRLRQIARFHRETQLLTRRHYMSG
jgi:serine/threonine protein kinase